jgi:hypothetical protein
MDHLLLVQSFFKNYPQEKMILSDGEMTTVFCHPIQLYSDIGFKQVNFSLRLFGGYYVKFLSHSVGITQKDDG